MSESRPISRRDLLSQFLVIDTTAPSGLRWKKGRGKSGAGSPAGRLGRSGYQVGWCGRYVYAHRIVFALAHGFDPHPAIIDHIDANIENNDPRNLRLCTRAENSRNVRPNIGSSSVYRGVWLLPDGARWAAGLNADGKAYRFGSFASEVEAAEAYNEGALKLHGEFARINDLAHPGVTISALQHRAKISDGVSISKEEVDRG